MTFAEWVKRQPRGALTKVHRLSGVSYSTVHAVSKGGAVKVSTAKRIAAATDGAVPWQSMIEGQAA